MSKNKLMFDLSNNSNSEPILAPGVFHKAMIGARTLETFTPILNSKDKIKLGIHQFGNVMQTSSCNPDDQGAGVLSEKIVEVEAISVYFSLCQRTLEQSFVSNQLAAGSNNVDFLPSDFQAYLGDKLAEKIASDLEIVTWQGTLTGSSAVYPATLTTGLEEKLQWGNGVVRLTGNTITASNVIAEIGRVYDAIDDAVINKEDLAIYASSNVIRAYRQALANSAVEAFYNQKDLRLFYLEVELIEAQGMSANVMAAGQKSNFTYMTDLINDNTDVLFIPQLDKTGKHQIIVSGEFKFAVDFAINRDMVFYKPGIAV